MVRWSLIGSLTAFLSGFLLANPVFANQDAANRLSVAAATTGTRILIIGFEGLAGFNASASNQAGVYQCQLSYGLPARKPLAITGQILTGLALPVIEKYKNKVKLLMFAHDACKGSGSGPEIIATQWMKDSSNPSLANVDGRRVIILGHSFGGDAALILGQALASKGISADVLTMDPRPRATGGLIAFYKKYGNGRWINYFETNDPVYGHSVKGAENHHIIGLHITLPQHRQIENSLMELIGDPPGDLTVADTSADQNTCSAAALGEAGVYRGTSGAIEAIPIAALVGGGGYAAYQLLKKKNDSDISGTPVPSGGGSNTVSSGGETAAAASGSGGTQEEQKKTSDGELEGFTTDLKAIQTSGEKEDSASSASRVLKKPSRLSRSLASRNLRGGSPSDTGGAGQSPGIPGGFGKERKFHQTLNNLGGATAALSTMNGILRSDGGGGGYSGYQSRDLPEPGDASREKGDGPAGESGAADLASLSTDLGDSLQSGPIAPANSDSLFLRIRPVLRKHIP